MNEINISFEQQKPQKVIYKNREIGLFRIDLVVVNQIVVEIKSTERMDPVYEAQILSYMKLGNYKLGLLINFNNNLLKQIIKRFIL